MTSDSSDYQTAIWAFYRYIPSRAAPILFAIIFTILSVIQGYQVYKYKMWYFGVFTVGGIFEVIGYIGRSISASQTPNWTLVPFIIQGVFLLLPPALFAASIYMTLGRLVRALDADKLSPVPPRWMTKMFVSGDVVSFMMQASGAGVMAGYTIQSLDTGSDIIVGGLCLQLLYFGFFVIAGGVFHHRINKNPTLASTEPFANGTSWRTHVKVLYVASVLIFARSAFRTFEYGLGNDGYLMRHEAFLYCFDSVLMMGVMVSYICFPPRGVTEQAKMKRAAAQAAAEDGQSSPPAEVVTEVVETK